MKHAFVRKPRMVYEDTQTKVDLSLICNYYDQSFS